MRQVDLTGGALSVGETGRTEKLTGHLYARMAELREDGLTVSCESGDGVGRVTIAFPNRDSRSAVKRLAAYGITAVEAAGRVALVVTDRVSHEDMDYVQGAVTEILSD